MGSGKISWSDVASPKEHELKNGLYQEGSGGGQPEPPTPGTK